MKVNKLLTLAVIAFLSATAQAEAPLDANTASEEDLAGLQHIGAAQAADIVASRPFKTWGDLNKQLAMTLSEEQLEELYANLFVPLRLNSAADADIQLIPGVGRRMAHEFEEYRPYTSMEQFRREIGKYVDADEVARYEQYVVLE